MAQDSEPKPGGPETLDERVDALLGELEREEGPVERELGPAAAEPDARVEAETDQPAAPSPKSSACEASAAAEAAVEGVERQVATLLEAVESNAEEAPPPKSTGSPAEVGALDAELAKLAEELVDTDFVEPEAEAPVEDRAQAAPPPPPAPPPSAAAPPAPSAAPAAPVVAPAVPAGPSLRDRAAEAARLVHARLAPVALAGARKASALLDSRPPIVRDAVGWLALVTAFWAIVVWTYVLIFRKPVIPDSHEAPVELSTPATDHAAMVRAAEAAMHEGDAGHGAPANDSHGAPAKDSHGKAPAKDSHAKAPAKDSHAKAPAKDSHAKAPAKGKSEKKSGGH